uniref:Genome polyprotein n=1 Tax=Slow bee paralysis virus TaxID=458132 RepID=D7PSF5_9VIRU|nr:polyprotein [Slow bee paralysis virus]
MEYTPLTSSFPISLVDHCDGNRKIHWTRCYEQKYWLPFSCCKATPRLPCVNVRRSYMWYSKRQDKWIYLSESDFRACKAGIYKRREEKEKEKLWSELCNVCSWECFEYYKFRDQRLLLLLRKKIADKAQCRCRSNCKLITVKHGYIRRIKTIEPCEAIELTNAETFGSNLDFAQPEMDRPEGSEERTVQSSNVVLGETNVESQDIASKEYIPSWDRLASSEVSDEYPMLTDRWLFWKSVKWEVNDSAFGKMLIQDKFPQSWVQMDLNQNSIPRYTNIPNFIPFNIHQYMRADFEVKIYVNPNDFVSGWLIMAFLYQGSEMFDYKLRRNPAALMQMPHVLVNVGAANEATLKIPYRYVRPFMRCKDILRGDNLVTGVTEPLNMGVLFVEVLIPFRTSAASSAPKSLDVSLFVKMTNAKFTGMVDGSIALLSRPSALPEMDKILDNGLGVVSKLLKDVNCDNPPDPTPAKFFVPVPSHSWAHGTNTSEPTNTLRLDGGVVGVGRSEDIGTSDTAVSGIIGVYGLLKPFDWNANDTGRNVGGHLLWSMPVHPQVDKDQVIQVMTQSKLTQYYLPPISVVSSLYAYTRGSIKYKFLFGNNPRHNARLLIAYIPGISSDNRLTLERARNSAHVVFSLNEVSEFVFTVPYITDTMWWPRKYGGPQAAGEFVAPSYICMFILNPLVAMESVPSIVTIVPMIAAGDDFEVAVPAQPAVGLSRNIDVIYPKDSIISFKSGYFPVYVGNWHSFFDSTKAILRYGAVSDHIAQLGNIPTNVNRKAFWVVVGDTIKFKTKLDKIDGTEWSIPEDEYTLGYGVVWRDGDYAYMVPYPLTPIGEKIAQYVASLLASGAATSQIQPYVPDYIVDSAPSKANILWSPIEDRLRTQNGWVMAEPEMERTFTPNVMQPTPLLPTTNDGRVTFGEAFNDLKDLARRYQLYWEGTILEGNLRTIRRNSALVQLPLYPHGLKIQPDVNNPIWNIMRDGHIPVISSGFRYFRGGLRLRIVVEGLNSCVWVQHHPDRPSIFSRPIIGRYIAAKDAYRNHAYAAYVQNMSVNRTIEVEVPFYQPGLYGMLNASDDNTANSFDRLRFTGLGDLLIGIEGEQPIPKEGVEISVYYSIADDFSFNIFCGFPPMVYCDETYSAATPDLAQYFDDEITVAQPEMMMSMCQGFVGSLIGQHLQKATTYSIESAKEGIRDVVKDEFKTQIKPELDNLNKVIGEAATSIGASFGDILPQQLIINAMGQLMQVFSNPSPVALAIAIVTFIGSIVTLSMEIVSALSDSLRIFLEKVWYRYFHQATEQQEAGASAMPEGFWDEADDKSLHGILGMIFSAICVSLGLSMAPPKQFPSVMKGVKESLNTANASVTFFRNVVDAIKYMYTYCMGSSDEELRARIIIEREYPNLKHWCEEVIQLLDPRSRNIVEHDARQASRVFDACIYGAQILQENLDKSMPGGKVIYDLYTRIVKLRDDLIELGNHPDVRFEAFPVWIVGSAGIGKSYNTTELCKRALQSINYRTKESMIYWLALGQKYWNGIRNPPVVARDEAYAVSGQFTEEEISVHLAMCSSCILNPPMAALSEKNKRINPLIYYMNANCAFPNIPEARHIGAIYRRRKILAEFDFTEEIKRLYPNVLDASELPPSARNNNNHLRIRVAHDPKNVNTTWSDWMSFDVFSSYFCRKFQEHMEAERINFRRRMDAAYALDPDYVPGSNLNYVGDYELPLQTLHERYIYERELAREYLANIENPANEIEEDGGFWSNVKRLYENLTTRTADSEMDVPGPSKPSEPPSKRILRQFLVDHCKFKEDSAALLTRGLGMCSEEDVRTFALPPEFEFMKDKEFVSAASIYCDTMSCLPNSVCCSYRRIGSAMNPRSKIGPNWFILPKNYEDLGGKDAIRSYCYWWIRCYQLRSFKKILKKENYVEWADRMLHLIGCEPANNYEVELRRQLWKIRCASELEMVEMLKELDAEARAHNMSDMMAGKELPRITLIWLLTDLTDNDTTVFCDHCKVFATYMRDLSVLEYVARYNVIRYPGNFGCMKTISAECQCENSIFNNVLFKNAMRILWDHDHVGPEFVEFQDSQTNPFVMQEHSSLRNETKSLLSRIWNWAKDWWKTTVIPFVGAILTFLYEHWAKILSIILGCVVLYATFTNAKSPTDACVAAAKVSVPVMAGAVGTWSSPEGGIYQAGERVFKASSAPKPANRESVSDQMHITEQKVINNTCFLVCKWQDGKDTKFLRARCLAIKGRDIIVIKHYLQEFKSRPNPTYMFSYRINNSMANTYIDSSIIDNAYIYKINNSSAFSNIALIKLPKHVPMFKDISKSIATQGDHANVGHFCSIVSQQYDEHPVVRSQVPVTWKQHLVIAGDRHVEQIIMDKCYEYNVRGFGMCGSALVSPGVCCGNGGVIGLHVAGEKGSGFSEPIFREMFEPVIEKSEPILSLPNLRPASESNVELDHNLILYGCVDEKMSHKESGKSKIVPSLVHGEIYPVTTEPNPLRPGDPRQPPGSHPLRDGCAKHGLGMVHPFPHEDLEQVNNDARNVLLNEVKNPLCEMRLLTLQEQICGSTSIPHCESVNWNSSEGFPLCNRRPTGATGKKWLFDMDETADGYVLKNIDPQLALMLKTNKDLRNRNIICPPIYIDCLKDYRLPPEKCSVPGKTRIFSIAPIQTTLEIREYMGLFLSGYKSATVVGQHGIGINPDSYDWTRLVNYLHEVGDNIVTGDYANFGPCVSSQIVYSCIDDIIYWHQINGATEDHCRHLELLLKYSILLPLHLCDNCVYQSLNGIASGSPITAELNSEVGKKYIKLAFLGICRQLGYKYTLNDFNKHCRVVVYGDDLILSVSDTFISWFNLQSISDYLDNFGIRLTDVTKDGTIIKYRSLIDSSFLKRSFKPHPNRSGIYLAPIEPRSYQECTNWCHKQNDEIEATVEVLRASCVLAYGRGPDEYNHHISKVRRVCALKGLKFDPLTWATLDKENFG